MAKKLVEKNASGDVERWGVEIPSTGYPYWMSRRSPSRTARS